MAVPGFTIPEGPQASRSPDPGALPRTPARPEIQHYRRAKDRPFTAAERESTTILFGGLTSTHEQLIQAVFQGCGYRCEILPTPSQHDFQIGKENGNNGQCSPAYFTSGSLVSFLRGLESQGIRRSEILDRYVYFTAGSCGPCRFGMYDSEYRLALQNAGFEGFRVLHFQQDRGIHQTSEEPGLRYTLNMGLGMLTALQAGDVLQDLRYQIRPFEVRPGETDQAIEDCTRLLAGYLRDHKPPEFLEIIPRWLSSRLARRRALQSAISIAIKFRDQMRGRPYLEILRACRERIGRVEVDRTQLRPIVKIVGEFWAQTTEGDGNYRMFEFLEREGAQVVPDPIGAWVCYLLAHARLGLSPRRGLSSGFEEPGRWELRQRLANEMAFQKKRALLSLGERIWSRQHRRVVETLGGLAHTLTSQDELARLADPYYEPLARGGEGHLEVGKNIYYNIHHLCHMVLSLKPFGCMPSSQSDGVQSAVVNRHSEMIFLPIETSGEGEINAHSRVQMALGDAKWKAKAELEEAVARTGKNLASIRAFVASRPALRHPFYPVPVRHGIAGVAARFVLHVSDLMDGKARLGAPRDSS